MAFYICPNCGTRVIDADGLEGLSSQPVGCHRCGFGFLFQLLEDWFPPAGAGLIACDRDARILSAGRGVFELTGYPENQLMGRELREALHMHGFDVDKDPVAVALEWGVRQLDHRVTIRHHAGHEKVVRLDLFPAYDEDGGLLCSIAPMLGAETEQPGE
jgi:PAS domain S-box-containing protein